MGAKTWMLVYAEGAVADVLKGRPQLDRRATQQLAAGLFPTDRLEPIGNGSLFYTCPPGNEVHIGCFPGVTILAAKEFGIDHPSRLPARFIAAGGSGTIYLHAMHSAVDWLAFAKWVDGKLIRALSLSPDSGVIEDIGQRLPFEEPFWAGQHPVETDEEESKYPLPFHPLELGELALKEFFGYQIEGFLQVLGPVNAESIPLIKFRRRPWWKVW